MLYCGNTPSGRINLNVTRDLRVLIGGFDAGARIPMAHSANLTTLR